MSMDSESANEYPWWEPYAFTGIVLLGVLCAGVCLGYLARIPFIEHAFFILMTVAGVYESQQHRATFPSIGTKIACVIFFCIAAYVYQTKLQRMFAIEFMLLGIVWLMISIQSLADRHRLRQQRLQRLDSAVSSLRRAKDKFDQDADGS